MMEMWLSKPYESRQANPLLSNMTHPVRTPTLQINGGLESYLLGVSQLAKQN